MTTRTTRLLVLIALLAPLSGCQTYGTQGTPDVKEPLFEGMGTHYRRITTSSARAQQYFNQGLTFAFSFNHDEAIRSFRAATALDPSCAMAWWGIALCNGPHINNPAMSPEQSKQAWAAIQQAIALKDHASKEEQALIMALSRRYSADPPADRRPLDEAYAHAMARVWNAYPRDPDVGSLYAESLMDLQPWDLWTHDGQPKGKTLEIVAVLETSIKLNINHPGANHLYIHAVEASPNPERAMPSADRLRRMVPATGHMVHMPAHIDVRTGQWTKAEESNIRAIAADDTYRAMVPNQNFYRVYMLHNHHFLTFADMMQGRSAPALWAAREMVASVPQEFKESHAAMVDPYMSIVLEVEMRFGLWDDILKEPAPAPYLPITTAMWRYTRGVAYAAKGEIDNAQRELAAFDKAAAAVPEKAMMAINPAHKILDIAGHVLRGEIAFREKRIDDAVTELRKAVELEDALQYMEPPEWLQPARHTLGAVLMSAGKFAEAEQVYRDDLKYWPENGWSLFGLAQSLKAQGKTEEAQKALDRFTQAWARSDIELKTTCLCVPGA